MAGLMERPMSGVTPVDATAPQAISESQALERMLSTRSPQRPQRTPTFYGS